MKAEDDARGVLPSIASFLGALKELDHSIVGDAVELGYLKDVQVRRASANFQELSDEEQAAATLEGNCSVVRRSIGLRPGWEAQSEVGSTGTGAQDSAS